MTLIYAGQEKGVKHLPSLFDADNVQWNTGKDYAPLMSRLYEIKKSPVFADSTYTVQALPGDVLLATHSNGSEKYIGIFPMTGDASLIDIDLPNGLYTNLISGENTEVHGGMLAVDGRAIILHVPGEKE